jgi:hypothetical protein
MAVNMKNAVFWDVMSCRSCKNRCFGGTNCLHLRVKRIGELETMLAETSNRSIYKEDSILRDL